MSIATTPQGTVSYAQLEGLWIRAGGPARLAPLAAAIAEAESHGDPNAVNPDDNNGTQTSWGLWQISNGTHAAPSPRWNDPLTNARLAVAKWKAKGNFTDWGTYNSGAYRQYLSNSTTPDTRGMPGATPSASGSADPGCLVHFGLPSVNVPIVGSIAGGGTVCLVRKSQARAWLGGLIIAGGGVILLGAFGILVGAGLQRTKAFQTVVQVTGFAGAPFKAAGRTVGQARNAARKEPAETQDGATGNGAGEGQEVTQP